MMIDETSPSPDLIFPRGLGDDLELAKQVTSSWFDPKILDDQAQQPQSEFFYEPGKIWLGRTPTRNATAVGINDNRHMVTVAGSRAGKGVSAIIPALCDYPGSMICIDPKGENAFHTAARRGFGTSSIEGMYQDVYVFDPYDISRVEREYLATFNPLADLSETTPYAIEQAGLIAEALVITTDPKNQHWDDSARNFIEALILHVISSPFFEGGASLGKVRILLRDGDTERLEWYINHRLAEIDDTTPEGQKTKRAVIDTTTFEILLRSMQTNKAFGGMISGAAQSLLSMGENERGSILSTARRNTKFLDSPEMQSALQPGDHQIDLKALKRAVHGMSVYIVLPARLMDSHSRIMRLMLNLSVAEMERDVKTPATGHAVLAILDEFASLGHMPVLETAAGYMAGFGLKIWAILQNLGQLKRHYHEGWETFLGNAGLVQFFGNSDETTLHYIASRLGQIEFLQEIEKISTSTTKGTSTASDFDKVTKIAGQGVMGDMQLGYDTTASSESTSTTVNKDQSIKAGSLMTPDEIRRYFSRGSGLQIIALNEHKPIFLKRTPYFEDPHFAGKFQPRGID